MNGPDFLDSNVIIYAYDDRYPEKQSIAKDLLKQGIGGRCVISTQVLAEFAVIMLHKVLPPRASAQAVLKSLDSLTSIRTINADDFLVRRAVEAHANYGVHFYDGMIVAAAERAGCRRIWSEDFNAGQEYFGIAVENPFQ